MMEKTLLAKKYSFYIGIDPGKNTGMALYQKDGKKLVDLHTLMIHEAMEKVSNWHGSYSSLTFYRVEDARKATYGRKLDGHKLKGAGSIMRDAVIWEDFLTDLGVDFEMVRPNKKITKIKADLFGKMTGWKGRTTSHSRDAALLVFGI